LNYKIIIEKTVQKTLQKIDRQDKERLLKSIYLLSSNPYPTSSTKLVNRSQYRLRVGRYRVIYEIHNDQLLIIVIKVGHRNNVYDD
jgi:mRNA interferase RelE/StbE